MSNYRSQAVCGSATPAIAAGLAVLPDDTLIAAVAKGDQRALLVLFSRHHSRVLRFASRFVKDRDTAETVVNDTFLIAWQRAARFEGRSQVGTWLLGIARYRALGAIKPRRPTCERLDEHADRLVDPRETVDDHIHREEIDSRLKRCIATLPREQAELIDLHYFHGVSLKDAERLTGVPINTIKTRMFLARRKLARMMADENQTPHPPFSMSIHAPQTA
jgi:RNA polymerase sigma-70 factor (ECF subfamily)